MRLYVKYVKMLFKSQMQYHASFWLLSAGQFLVPFSVFAALYFLFERFGSVAGWTFYETALCFSIVHISFSITECFARGFDAFSGMVAGGTFDRILARPRSTFLQVLGSKFEFTRIGRLIQGVAVFVIALVNLPVEWTFLKVILLGLTIISGIFVFGGIFILAATLCFWTIQGIEVANIFTDGGREMSQYPLDIYKKWVTKLFTFVIPYGCISYLPLMYILDKIKDGSNPVLYMLSPLYGILFIVPCLTAWKYGVSHYRSTGS